MDRSNGKHICMLPQPPKCIAIPPTNSGHPYQMCSLRGLSLPSEWHHGTALFIRSQKRLRDERARMKGIVCHPYSALTFYWQCYHLALTLVTLLYVPFQVFIHCPNPYDSFILFTDVNAFFNLLGCFITGYMDEDYKMIVLKPRLIAKHYLRSTFLPDFIGMLPLQLVHIYDDCRYPSHTVMLSFKLFRLFTWCKEWKILLDQLEFTYVTAQVISIAVKVVLFFHWMTYFHHQTLSFAMHSSLTDDITKKWKKAFMIWQNQHNSICQKYASYLFYVSGLCIGSGFYNPDAEHILPEFIFTSFAALIGLLFLTYSFSTLLQLAIYKQYETNLFNGRSMELKKYMVFKRLPKYLQRKIQLFINYKFNGHYFNEEIIMSTINEQIKQDINMYGCKRLVMSVPLFQDMPIALINSIIFSLTQVLYMPGELLVQYGQPGSSLYMISSGTVAVMSATGREVAHLRDGAYFGESPLLHPGTLRTATIIALEITEIYKLDSKEFQVSLQPYPHLRRRLEDTAFRRRHHPSRQDKSQL